MPRVMLTWLGENFGRAATSSRGCISLHPSGQQPGQLFGRRKCASVNNTVGVDCVRNLYGKIAIAVSVTLFATASSRAKENEACISKASKTLPHISGLVIKKTRTLPVPQATLPTSPGQTPPIIVDVDTVVGDEQLTHSYMCVLKKGAAYVRRVMS